jgi:hypothetical protein
LRKEHTSGGRNLGRKVAVALTTFTAALVIFTGAPASAQGPSVPAATASPAPQAPPPSPPPPAASPGSYPTPMSQTTQETYVPQSVAMSGPETITDWREGDTVPSGFHPVQRMRRGFIVAGAVTFGSLYLISAFGAAAVHDANANRGTDNADALFVPAVGPFIQMGRTTSAFGNMSNLIDGIVQCGGLTMLIYGLTTPRTILVRNDLGMTFLPVPYVSSRGAGLGWVGTF